MKEEQSHLEQLSTRVKEELPKFMEQQFGHFEQQPPNKPSFLLVVVLFAATLVVVLIIAWTLLRWGGGARFLNRAHRKVPTAQLILPARPQPAPQPLSS